MSIERRSGLLPYLFSRAAEETNKPAPLVLFLHGARDRGTDINVLLKWGLPRFVDESSPLPYFFVAPQLPEGQTWVDREADVIALLDNLIVSQSIDPSRVILSGFSLGTAGAWHIAAAHPGRFAGLVAVSGRVPKTLEANQLAALKEIPIQIFQGAKDEKLSVEDTQQIVDTLHGLGGTVDFTVIPEGDHFIADEVYTDSKLQQWLISQSRRPASVVA
ncbi:Phospholipase/Carboxylesterase [Trichormus variabilis ATCC 29413]|uniref:Phospholipase/Carboxylesterase n=2 Tax=Anabaena variabilis TaxID=264691 RepID=Q3M5J3_TRIV2|nr:MULTISPECIES: dienelactone hydrolase family protein [Nostocaceae]ABA23743.1 Phospholipase/Carboxylesterase [Trichormus variabilis ATCC 29413]MBC1213551.1 dienelactone hydrolase family protein [Trichormus variabilis ARAD]MBC1253924.1 dienelactone hydrolase family protein [Trichormus variabilis V5]MBC1265845.1 dienelactone hydrolase family protein [Trichormus variabilis FSR]MBC1300371.1 dienelactone hydrolase family protein [Trichormus variabilis N2B]